MVSLLVTVIAAVSAASIPAGDSVLELTRENFTATINSPNSRLLVQFYLPWCTHCQRFAPAFGAAAAALRTLRASDPTFVGQLARVDAEAELDLAAQQGAPMSGGFPRLFWYADGEASEYRGGRSTEDLVDLVMHRGGPLVTSLDNSSRVDHFRLSFPLALVATLAADADARAVRALEEVCRARSETVRCGRALEPMEGVTPESLYGLPSKGPAQLGAVVLYRAVDDATVRYQGDLLAEVAASDEEDAGGHRRSVDVVARLRRFVEANELPPVVRYGPDTQRQLFESSIDAITLLLLPHEEADGDGGGGAAGGDSEGPQSQQQRAWVRPFEAAAAAMPGEALFAVVDASQHNATIGAFFGTNGAPVAAPAIALYQKRSHTRHVLRSRGRSVEVVTDASGATHSSGASSGGDEPLAAPDLAPPSADDIMRFVRGALAKEVEPLRHSAPLPQGGAAGAAGAVTALAGRDYAAAVLGASDVLVLLHTPWGIACKAALQAMEALAASRTNDGGVRLASLDVSLNEVDGAPALESLPAVRLFRAGAASLDDGVPYEGAVLDEAALGAFLDRERATIRSP